MREYKNTKDGKLRKLVCNQCGKEISLSKEIPREGVFRVCYTWDYMSEKDGMQDSFDLCEECYDKLVSAFRVPVDRREVTEYL